MITYKTMAVLTALLTLLLLQVEARADMDANHRFSTTVPCKPLVIGLDNTHLPLVSVRVNGSVTATFLVDTGTNFLAVTDTFAKKLKIVRDASNQAGYPNTISGQIVHTTTLKKIEIGKIVLNNISLIILPPGGLAGLEKSIDGVLGSNFLSKVAFIWKPSQRELTFFAPGNFTSRELLPLGFSPNASVPMAETPNGLWTVQVDFINSSRNASSALVVDTGSVTTSVSLLQSDALNLQPTATNILKWSFSGVEKISTAQVDKMTIGSTSLYNLPVDYSKEIIDLAPATLGVNVLSRFIVLIDFPAKKMYLQPNTAAAVPAITIGPAPAPTAPPAK